MRKEQIRRMTKKMPEYRGNTKEFTEKRLAYIEKVFAAEDFKAPPFSETWLPPFWFVFVYLGAPAGNLGTITAGVKEKRIGGSFTNVPAVPITYSDRGTKRKANGVPFGGTISQYNSSSSSNAESHLQKAQLRDLRIKHIQSALDYYARQADRDLEIEKCYAALDSLYEQSLDDVLR